MAAAVPSLTHSTFSNDLRLGLTSEMVDQTSYDNAVQRFREQRIVLPTFAQLADPSLQPAGAEASLVGVDPDAMDARNLWRVNWFNGADRKTRVTTPLHLVLPGELTGINATIVVVRGNTFPMIRAHKVLAAYACLAPRVVTGQFDPTRHRAIWPSTGNYARGGVAISRIMHCRGTAVLPEGMSAERFEWLARWTEDPSDVVRTPGTESNVKEIYDACNVLAQDPQNVILNQFSEFANHLGHFSVTGPGMAAVYESVAAARAAAATTTSPLRLAAFVSATGSAGTIGAGDYLKDRYGTKVVAVEALECPTLLYNGFGEHNIQGIGDKHVPLIHNVTNTDVIVGISDRATDQLDLLFNTPEGMNELRQRGVDPAVVEGLTHLGYSAICNVLAAVKTAKALGLDGNDVIVTVATDGHELYISEFEKFLARDFGGSLSERDAAAIAARHLDGIDTEHLIECSNVDRNRVFNLGYYTWVEQQGTKLVDFEARRNQEWWRNIRALVAQWDERIIEFNQQTQQTGQR